MTSCVAVSQFGTHSLSPLIHGGRSRRRWCVWWDSPQNCLCFELLTTQKKTTQQQRCNCSLIAPQRFPQVLLIQIKQHSTWINSAEFKPGTLAVWGVEVVLDPVGGTAPVISAAMFNLQSDQSRGTPRKRTPAARLEHSAGSFISFCILSRSTERAKERSNEAEGEFAAEQVSAKQNCARTPSSVPVRLYPTGLTCLFVNHAIQMTTWLRLRGLLPCRNATSQSFGGYTACVRLQWCARPNTDVASMVQLSKQCVLKHQMVSFRPDWCRLRCHDTKGSNVSSKIRLSMCKSI